MPTSPFANLPRFRPGSFWLLVAATAASAFVSDLPLARVLLLGAPFLGETALWQPLTAPLLFPDGQLAGLIGTALLQWLVGSQVEARLGTARYLGFVLGAAILGYLVLGLLGLAVPAVLAVPHGGTTPVDVAAVVAFGVVFARQPLALFGVLPLTSRSFAGLAVAFLLVPPLLRGAWPDVVPGLVAGCLALVVARRWQNRPASGKVGPRKGGGGKRPRHLRIVDGREQYLN
ncbi:rhomboid family intramembrane serine protease [Nannocystis punicea]|uniref:Rhomboid family intramembrane serine protease n=1 Tax=Nannocystis punicea TaxID=2995304 RepID=A0ABY7HAL1_9BACT|nr:rhomboid family intramembrane serine protease [Nannocystis poenicansa]WAS96130.1 rhomboid family intramembrane serine protease [Nannocystis poenicansa]